MKRGIPVLKWSLAGGFYMAGALAILWGIFCFLGGPDPGAGSGGDGLKYGIVFAGTGVTMLIAGRAVWNKLNAYYEHDDK